MSYEYLSTTTKEAETMRKHGKQWRKPGVQYRAISAAGRHGWPVWAKTKPSDHGWPLEPSDDLKARYKEDCPNNYKALLAAFGKTRTK